MVVWGLGRGECESLFIWSVTEKPTELDRKENPREKQPSNHFCTMSLFVQCLESPPCFFTI